LTGSLQTVNNFRKCKRRSRNCRYLRLSTWWI